MLNLGVIGFAQPWLLLALVGLPVLWILLRVTPPSPRRLGFPAIGLLFGLKTKEETPARTPLWLLILRSLIACLAVLALAQPLLHPSATLSGSGPLIMIIDDGWAAARNWTMRLETADSLLQQAERESRDVILITTAPIAGAEEDEPRIEPRPAAEIRRSLQSLQPKPWPVDRAAAAKTLETLAVAGQAHAVWISDGLADGGESGGQQQLAESLLRLGQLDVFRDEGPGLAPLLLPPESDGVDLMLRATRADPELEMSVDVEASGEDGTFVGSAQLTFAEGEREARAALLLPTELRNRISRLQIANEAMAGATVLIDERWRRRPVGLLLRGPADDPQPLLSEIYYLERAIEPFAELRKGGLRELLQRELAILILPDANDALPADEIRQIENWIAQGGILLRFAGPRLAGAPDDLLPVTLRGGGRTLGGAMTWDRPARLGAFPQESPFRGLAIPDDVVVDRQVLAEPTLDLSQKTWARLDDGTPLVTAEAREKGWVVLFHTTANTDWTNLAISGLFVEMLERILGVSQGVTADTALQEALPPIEVLDGFGTLQRPAATVRPLEAAASGPAVSAINPPGYYGSEGLRRAHNLGGSITALRPLDPLPPDATVRDYRTSGETDLKPWLLAATLLLATLDLMIALVLRGLASPGVRRAQMTQAILPFVMFATLALSGGHAAAQSDNALAVDTRALAATLQTHLAYVITDALEVDDTSEKGLHGLSLILQRRTSVEAGPPLGVDLERDELGFFPLIYWPITAEQNDLSEAAVARVNDYLKNGGTILIDLRDPGGGAQIFGQPSEGSATLQRMTRSIRIPPLTPVPPDHVLTKSFYLMQDFPGRYAGGTLWIEAGDEHINDGVASILIGSNDWAGAWAVNRLGQPLNAVVPGGPQQREMAYRFGVNLVMYALTGNYKADQVHVPFILERLGQ